MTAYEFYLRDERGKEHFIGILPERRGKPERITNDSILNRGTESHGSSSDSRVAEVEEVFAPVVNFDTGFLFLGTIP